MPRRKSAITQGSVFDAPAQSEPAKKARAKDTDAIKELKAQLKLVKTELRDAEKATKAAEKEAAKLAKEQAKKTAAVEKVQAKLDKLTA